MSQPYTVYNSLYQPSQAEYSGTSASASSQQDSWYAEPQYPRDRDIPSPTTHADYGSSGLSTAPYTHPLGTQPPYVGDNTSRSQHRGQPVLPHLDAHSTWAGNFCPPVHATPATTTSSTYDNVHAAVQGWPGHSYSSGSTAKTSNHYAIDSGEVVACACGKTFTGAAKNANANRKRHIQTKADGSVYACPNRRQGCSYVANRKDNVAAHYQRACRYSSDAT